MHNIHINSYYRQHISEAPRLFIGMRETDSHIQKSSLCSNTTNTMATMAMMKAAKFQTSKNEKQNIAGTDIMSVILSIPAMAKKIG